MIVRLGFVRAVLLAVSLGACSAAADTPPPGSCGADARAPGTYPALEARLPGQLAGKAPSSVDSGRDCSAAALGSLVDHGVGELDFAGATWDSGNGEATSIAILALPAGQALAVAWAEEFYEAGARNAKKTDHVDTSRPTLATVGAVFRLDTLNDLSFQTVVVWPDGPVVRVAIVATPVNPAASRDAHDGRVAQAVAAAASMPHVAPS